MSRPDAASIRDRIVARREARVAAEGPTLGVSVPASREESGAPPPHAFPLPPPLICEIKRKSPSRGYIDPDLDPVALAGQYAAAGARSLSVLTEEDHFAGSLADLMAVKRAFPELSVLRKDFLLTDEDVEVSYRAGADAVLLIASVLGPETLGRLHARAAELGVAALVEVHDDRDLAAARAVGAPLVGINARDLATFRIDPLLPLRLKARIDWPATVVYESGVFYGEQVTVAVDAGFGGLLVGESVVRDPGRVAELAAALRRPVQVPKPPFPEAMGRPAFWTRIATRPRPMVKICGITRAEDGRLAAELGAAALGFVFADSPRRARPEVVRELATLDVARVAVVVGDARAASIPPEVSVLLAEGALDAVQFHGDEAPEACASAASPYYKAVRLRDPDQVPGLARYRCPRVLVDAYDPRRPGGTGLTVDPELIRSVAAERPLWLAGGLGPDNIRAVISQHRPELVDASSRLESEPGCKDHHLLRQFFREIDRG